LKKIIIALLLISVLSIFSATERNNYGDLVLVGGGPMPPGLIKWIIDKKPDGKILLITYDGLAGAKWQELLSSNESVEIIVPEQFKFEKLSNVGAVLLDGGHQYEYIMRLDPKVLESAHESGILIFGTSAGAMILGEYYFSAKNGGVTSEEACENPNGDKICVDTNFLKLKKLKNTLVETHYSERDREGRLRVFIEKFKGRGIGIDESTALCITGNQIEVIGKGGVHFLTTQGNSYISLYQDGTSNCSRVCERSGRK
jgi:cyanophycinase